MNRKSIIDSRAANGWIIALMVAANILWSFFTLLIAFYVLDVRVESIETMQVRLLFSEFIGAFIIGWFCGWLSFNGRGATDGVVGALGRVFMLLLTLLASGGIASLLSIAALAGGFNSDALTRYRGRRQSV